MTESRDKSDTNSARIDRLIEYLIGGIEEISIVEPEISEWDTIERIAFLVDFGPTKANIERISELVEDGALTKLQRVRFEELERVVEVNMPILTRLEDKYLT